jgi:hypothetical protein
MDGTHRKIVDNMQILHECRDSRNDHMQTRTRERVRGNAVEGGQPGNEVEEIDMSEVLEHLEDIDRMSSKRQDEVGRDTQECLDALTEAGFFSTSEHRVFAVDGAVEPE